MFYSVLFTSQAESTVTETVPSCFSDMNLDQFLYPLFMNKQAYELAPYFYTQLRDTQAIHYRQEIMQELEDEGLRSLLTELSETVYKAKTAMDEAVEQMTSILTPDFDTKPRENYFVRGLFLNNVTEYCGAIVRLAETVSNLKLRSAGLCGFAEYISDYTASQMFTKIQSHSAELREKLKSVQYNVLLKDTPEKGGRKSRTIRVGKYNGEDAYGDDLLKLFEKFKQSDGLPHKPSYPKQSISMGIENVVLQTVSKRYKSLFDELFRFCAEYLNYMDETILRFAREIQFYLGWHEHIAPMREAGFSFCYPELMDGDCDIYGRGIYDIALARRRRDAVIIPNDFELNAPEQIIVITGPNQGGKTTFSRAFGQIHFFASLGLCVPGIEARLFLCDKILTHFSRQEDISMMSGQLQDDLQRLKELFGKATQRSIIIINEIFASTTLHDALSIGRRMIGKLTDMGAPALVITFLSELAEYGDNIISIAGIVDENEPEERTFRFLRKQPETVAYAMHIAKKYGLTYDKIVERLAN